MDSLRNSRSKAMRTLNGARERTEDRLDCLRDYCRHHRDLQIRVLSWGVRKPTRGIHRMEDRMSYPMRNCRIQFFHYRFPLLGVFEKINFRVFEIEVVQQVTKNKFKIKRYGSLGLMKSRKTFKAF